MVATRAVVERINRISAHPNFGGDCKETRFYRNCSDGNRRDHFESRMTARISAGRNVDSPRRWSFVAFAMSSGCAHTAAHFGSCR